MKRLKIIYINNNLYYPLAGHNSKSHPPPVAVEESTLISNSLRVCTVFEGNIQ
jgi:hypothetical protein